MRHKLTGRQLSRNAPHRHALMRNMAGSLLRHETIHTTLPKAKELRRVVEPLITLGKSDSEANRRLAYSRLRDGELVGKLFTDLGPRFRARPGGYTRILRLMPRAGDAAPMALMQLVDRPGPEAVPASGPAPKRGARRADASEAAEPSPAAAKAGKEKPARAAKPDKSAKSDKASKAEAKAEAAKAESAKAAAGKPAKAGGKKAGAARKATTKSPKK